MTITLEEMQKLDEDLNRRVEEGAFAEGKGQKNAYTCSGCKKSAITVNRNAGTTPMWISCPNPDCGGEATSRMYRIDQTLPALFEWYRPMTEEEIREALEGDDQYGSHAEHIRSGGLAFRRIPEDRVDWAELSRRVRLA